MLRSQVIALLTAALAGALMALQGAWNSQAGKIAGLWETTLLVHLTGAVLAAALLPFFGAGSLSKLADAPWYTWLGGTLGVAIIVAVAAGISEVGMANATTAIVVAQILVASILDHFGVFGLEALPFTWWRLLGGGLLAGGVWCILH